MTLAREKEYINENKKVSRPKKRLDRCFSFDKQPAATEYRGPSISTWMRSCWFFLSLFSPVFFFCAYDGCTKELVFAPAVLPTDGTKRGNTPWCLISKGVVGNMVSLYSGNPLLGCRSRFYSKRLREFSLEGFSHTYESGSVVGPYYLEFDRNFGGNTFITQVLSSFPLPHVPRFCLNYI